MAQSYCAVLDAVGASYHVLGRGRDSADSLAAIIRRPVRVGGVEANRGWIAAEGFDAAIVCVDIESLAEVTVRLLECGIRSLLVEKPAGLSLTEIGRVSRFVKSVPEAKLYVAYNRRFFASVIQAERMIEEDGGLTSFHFEFTEVSERVLSKDWPPSVLENWILGNSSHVIDLAFFFGGRPKEISSRVSGALEWHPAGAVFTGTGEVDKGVLFSFHADWKSAGRWSVDLRTARRRILLCPLEELTVQWKGSFNSERFLIQDELDQKFKPGLYRMTEAFLSSSDDLRRLPTIDAHLAFVTDVISKIAPETGIS